MRKQIAAIFALLLTTGLLQVGHGAVSAMIIQYGGQLKFSATVLGLLTAAMYVGMIAGNILQRRLLPRISYIRTFAVCATITTLLSMFLPMLPDIWTWLLMRVIYGVFYSVAMVVCMDWVNSKSTQENRSRLMGTMMTVMFLAYGLSQYILLLGKNHPDKAFILATAFLLFSLVPVCLTRFPEPQAPPRAENSSISLREAYQVAPVSYIGQFGFGLATGAGWLFISYLDSLNVSSTVGATMAVVLYGSGFILQLPMGWLSDKLADRRNLIVVLAGASAALAALLFFGSYMSSGILLFLLFMFSAISNPLYSLNISYGQGFVDSGKSADYSFRLIQIYAIGALIGPPITGFLMSTIAPDALFAFIGIIFAAVTIITATNRFMPHYRPAHTEQLRPLSPLMASQAVSEEVMYSELDIGPDFSPISPQKSIMDDTAAIGPDLPDEPITAADAATMGPDFPDEATAETEIIGPASSKNKQENA